MAASSLRSRLIALALAAAPLALAAAAPASAAPLPPSLSPDTTGGYGSSAIAKYDFASGGSTSAEDGGGGAAADPALDRYYAIGSTGTGTAKNLAVVARRSNGALDTRFDGDGAVSLAIGAEEDAGSAAAVLPDGNLLVLGYTDSLAGSSTNYDVFVARLTPAGLLDPTFGTGGKTVFAVDAGADKPARMAIAPDGRIAVVGTATTATGDDTFVAVLSAGGALLPSFGVSGVQQINQGGGSVNDRGVGVAWRPGSDGVVALIDVAPTTTTNSSVLHAFTPAGAADLTFGTAGDRVIDAGGTDTPPAALIPYAGRLWATGSIKAGGDVDGYLARVEADGSAQQSRRFDIRGTAYPASQAVVTQPVDLTVVPGDPDTLVVLATASAGSTIGWGSAAFNGLDGNVADLGYGDLVIPTSGFGTPAGLAAAGGGAVTVGGTLLDSSFDTSIGQARLLVDAEKRCDLAITIPSPLEAVFRGGQDAALRIKVVNGGKRACAGEIGVPAPYVLTTGGRRGPIATGRLEPGASVTLDVGLAYDAPRPAEDTLVVKLTAPADTTTGDNTASIHVLFSHCDAALRRVGGPGVIAAASTRRFEFNVANLGTATCRGVRIEVVSGGRRVGRPEAYTIAPGRSATDEIEVAVAKTPRAGRPMPLRFRIVATADVLAADDGAGVSPKVVRGGDSNARRPKGGGRSYGGSASAGQGPRKGKRGRLAVQRVDVAIQRMGGKGCRWVSSLGGSFETVAAGRGRACDAPVWIAASGTRHWRLKLARKLPKGRYTLLTRAVLTGDLAENAFSAKDRNRIQFRVR